MINITTKEDIRIISFQTPNGNLLTYDDINKLIEHLERFEKDEKIKGIILTGTGRSFSTGLDTTFLIDNFSKNESDKFFKLFDSLLIQLFSFSKPVIAAVNGHSIGGGLLLQSTADLVYISNDSNAKLGLPELKLGLTIDSLMKSLLCYRLNNNEPRLFELLLNSNYIDYSKSNEYGLVDSIFTKEELLEKSIEKMQILTKYNNEAYKTTKKIIKCECLTNMQKAFKNNCFNDLTNLLKNKTQS